TDRNRADERFGRKPLAGRKLDLARSSDGDAADDRPEADALADLGRQASWKRAAALRQLEALPGLEVIRWSAARGGCHPRTGEPQLSREVQIRVVTRPDGLTPQLQRTAVTEQLVLDSTADAVARLDHQHIGAGL